METKGRVGKSPLMALLVVGLVACGQTPSGVGGGEGVGGTIDYAPEPAPLHDTIAYVSANGDQIRLIDPDGSNDRLLWAHGLADPESVYDVWSMEWNAAATRLAFASTHENWCSIFASDIFYVGADGSGYSRVTQAPACDQLADFPQGVVRIPVKNEYIDSFSGFIYFQGATGVQPVNLPPSGTGMVTFGSVADFGNGPDAGQIASIIEPPHRYLNPSTIVDVAANSTVTTAETSMFTTGIFWEAHSPTWRRDGSRVGLIYDFNSFVSLPVEPGPLEYGTSLLAEGADMPTFTRHLAWGPTADRASSLLYYGSDPAGSAGIYLVEEGNTGPGAQLVNLVDPSEAVLDLAWLPDASGFVFTVTAGDYYPDTRGADIYIYDFTVPEIRQLTTINSAGEYAGRLSVSPDGDTVVFERAGDIADVGYDLVAPDLWLLDLTTGSLELLVEDGRAPAWSW